MVLSHVLGRSGMTFTASPMLTPLFFPRELLQTFQVGGMSLLVSKYLVSWSPVLAKGACDVGAGPVGETRTVPLPSSAETSSTATTASGTAAPTVRPRPSCTRTLLLRLAITTCLC